jgi:hypothetical protein
MIEKKPENRFQTFHDILLELQEQDMVPESAALVPRVQPHRAQPQRQFASHLLQRALERRKTRLGRIISVLLLLLLLAIFGWTSGYIYRTFVNPP